ncbi:4642_t:CDS:2 [Dentiscutata heterogama]|uniref:4642_t:CDS:1 n=1 Tax=Dentiscutata heterogama TaxID=1316150 RepID=A0ACA9N608_9GLOM|nr:4642_t:CDS:2 [Dentiscutata heterogama]
MPSLGHTRNSVDHGFGNTKRKYSRSEIWCIGQFAEVIERSSHNNISKYHLFQFSCERSGIIKAKVKVTNSWDEFQLIKQGVDVNYLNSLVLPRKELLAEKQVDL